MDKDNIMHQDTVALDPETEELVILDQTRLPGQTVFLRLSTAEAIYQAIYTLQVRGAPAIGVAAAIGIYAVCRRMPDTDYETFAAEFERIRAYLVSARPTAVNLAWALEQMAQVVREHTGCPVPDRTGDYVATVEQNRATGQFGGDLPPDSFGFRTADEAYAVFSAGKDALRSKVLLHGDYCLPNILLQDWALSGFIDVGCGGVGDRHIDLFWGAWTLQWNLKTDQYRSRFFDAYGRDALDEPLLEVIAAAEVFG